MRIKTILKTWLLLAAMLFAMGAGAQKSESDMLNYINTQLPSASSIKMAVLRDVLQEMVKSSWNTTDDMPAFVRYSEDGASWHATYTAADIYVSLSNDGVTWSDAVLASDLFGLPEKALPVSGDLLLIEDSEDGYAKKRVTVNALGVGGGSGGIDSVWQVFNTDTEQLVSYYYAGGILLDSSTADLSDTYLKIADSDVPTVTIPVSGSLTTSVAAMIEGTDYPTGWTFNVIEGKDLQINHDAGRYVTAISVSYNVSGVAYQYLVPFQTAYNNFINTDLNTTTIVSLSGKYTATKLRIGLIFE